MSATFTKLKSGEWGIRVVGAARPGMTVTVSKKDGTTDTKTIGKVVWSGNGVTICTMGGVSVSGGDRRYSSSRRKVRTCPHCGGNDINQVDCGYCA